MVPWGWWRDGGQIVWVVFQGYRYAAHPPASRRRDGPGCDINDAHQDERGAFGEVSAQREPGLFAAGWRVKEPLIKISTDTLQSFEPLRWHARAFHLQGKIHSNLSATNILGLPLLGCCLHVGSSNRLLLRGVQGFDDG